MNSVTLHSLSAMCEQIDRPSERLSPAAEAALAVAAHVFSGESGLQGSQAPATLQAEQGVRGTRGGVPARGR